MRKLQPGFGVSWLASLSRSPDAEIPVAQEEADPCTRFPPTCGEGSTESAVVGARDGDPVSCGSGVYRRDLSLRFAVPGAGHRQLEPRSWFRDHHGGLHHDDALALTAPRSAAARGSALVASIAVAWRSLILILGEIGRASCRERAYSCGYVGCVLQIASIDTTQSR